MPSERIQLFIDIVTGNAKGSLSRLTTDLKNTEGAFNKAKVAGSAMGDFFKRNLALGAASAGTALVGFGISASKAFTDAGVAAGKLRDATGLASEEASRLAEVGSDIGIPAETLATAIGRMNRAAENTPQAFSGIGAALKQAKDGSLDVNETFLSTIDAIRRIPNAAQQADAAQKIFGRGWQQIAELVSMGADEVRTALESVSDAQVFDDAEIAKAREMRDRLEDLQDQFLAIQLTVGEFVVDVVDGMGVVARGIDTVVTQAKRLATLQDLRNQIFGTDEALGSVKETLGQIPGPVAKNVAELERMAEAYRKAGIDAEVVNGQFLTGQGLIRFREQASKASEASAELQAQLALEQDRQRQSAEAAEANAEAHREAADAANEQADAFRRAADAVYNQRNAHRDAAEAVSNVQTVIDDEESSMTDLAKALDDAATAAASAADADVRVAKERRAAKGETISATRELGIFNRSLLEQAATASGPARSAIVDYIATMNDIPPEKASEILALIDEGKLEQAQRKLNRASEPREATITADAETAAAQAELDQLDNTRTMQLIVNPTLGGPIPRFASGGTVSESGMALVGEQGPELVALPGGAHVSTASRTRSMLSGRAGGSVRSNLRRAESLTRQADEAQALAKALREQAEATEDSTEKSRLNEEASKAAAKADELFERAQARVEKASNAATGAVGRQADALRALAESLRAQAEAARAAAETDQERVRSLTELVDAQLAYEDAAVATREALGHAARAFTVEGVSRAQQAAAINDAQQAALQQAQAAVERERERAEAAGREFTQADAARVMQRELERLAAVGGPVGKALQDLIKRLNFPEQIRLAKEAERNLAREEALLARAEKREERAGELDERRARAWDRAMDRTGKVFEQLANDRLTPAQARKMIREAFAEAARSARGGRR